jgi:hypothetical protein
MPPGAYDTAAMPDRPTGDVFPTDYRTARARFRDAASAAGFALSAHATGQPDPFGNPAAPAAADLTIDVAIGGDPSARGVVVLTSGLHGAEGPFGSAVQSAWLESLPPRWTPPAGVRVVLMHALNPWGFARLRRTDEDNVDLNRNFLPAGEEYRGSAPLADLVQNALSPRSRPRGILRYALHAAWFLLRYGQAPLRQALPVGQFDFPEGLFFGGRGPARVHRLLAGMMPGLLAGARRVVHLDYHTGLGPWADYRLLLEEPADDPAVSWWRERFDADRVESGDLNRTAYPVRGGFGPWCQRLLPAAEYLFATAEYGTYGPLRMLWAMESEMRAHWADPSARDPGLAWARSAMAESFCPTSPDWRRRAVASGVGLIATALANAGGGG